MRRCATSGVVHRPVEAKNKSGSRPARWPRTCSSPIARSPTLPLLASSLLTIRPEQKCAPVSSCLLERTTRKSAASFRAGCRTPATMRKPCRAGHPLLPPGCFRPGIRSRGSCGIWRRRLAGTTSTFAIPGDMASGRPSPAYDRVVERRRAVALARHFREAEGLSIAQIADRLGRSPATIKAYFYDPTGEKARAVKARYVGVCRGCGAYTQPRNGKGDAYAYCKACHPGAIERRWTRERVLAAMRAWRDPLRDGCRRRTTGRARTHADAAARRSSDWRRANGPRRASSRTSSERGLRLARRRRTKSPNSRCRGSHRDFRPLCAIPGLMRGDAHAQDEVPTRHLHRCATSFHVNSPTFLRAKRTASVGHTGSYTPLVAILDRPVVNTSGSSKSSGPTRPSCCWC